MIVDFESYLSENLFKNNVLPLISRTETPFSYFKESFQSLIILERQPLFFLFLAYIPTGHHTHLPTLEQSMRNENGTPRESTGEWVVETIFQTRDIDAKLIFEKIDSEKVNENVINFIRDELYRF